MKVMKLDLCNPEKLYKIGFIIGYYEGSKAWENYYRRLPEDTPWWHPDEIDLQDENVILGIADGKGSRPPRDEYFDEGAFFAFDTSGFPWGSELEQERQKKSFHLVWHQYTCDDSSRHPDDDGNTEWYSLTRDPRKATKCFAV